MRFLTAGFFFQILNTWDPALHSKAPSHTISNTSRCLKNKYQTYLIPNPSDTETYLMGTRMIANLSDTKPSRYRTYLIWYLSSKEPGTLTLRPPTNRPRDIPIHMKSPQNCWANLLLWHSDPVTIIYFEILTQSGWIVRPPKKMDCL